MKSGGPDVHEIEFVFGDSSCQFVYLSTELGSQLDLLEVITDPEREDRHVVLLIVRESSTSAVEKLARNDDRLGDLRVLSDSQDEPLCTIPSRSECITPTVHETSSILQTATAHEGELRVVVSVPPGHTPEKVVDAVQEAVSGVTVSAIRKRPIAEALSTEGELPTQLKSHLTERQWTALELAYQGGYFRRPRGTTQKEIAQAMGISQETVSQHLRAAQQNLLAGLFGEDLSK